MIDLIKPARTYVLGYSRAGRTHWDGCEREHIECLIQRLADEIELLRILLSRVVGDHRAPADCYSSGPMAGGVADVACPSCAADQYLAAIRARGEKP